MLTAHPGKRLENNYSLNTVDICPVGALTSSDFRFKMRVWFLKETKSFCTSCATGCNTIIGSREDVIYRQTPRENDAVNSCWMCDYGRLNFDYLQSDRRLLEPLVCVENKLQPATWKHAIESVAAQLKPFVGWQIAILASGRMTNEELWLDRATREIVRRDPHRHRPAHRAGRRHSPERRSQSKHKRRPPPWASPRTEATVLQQIKDAIWSGQIRALISLGENPLRSGITTDDLERLPVYIVMDLLANEATGFASAVLPSLGFAEKRGSMINGKGRLQRLNRAVRGPGAGAR